MSDLANLKPGDHVVVCGRFGQHVDTVKKVGKIHIFLEEDSCRFRIDNGRQVNADTWWPRYISINANDFVRAKKTKLREWQLETRSIIKAMRTKCDMAEGLLREIGEWEETP